MGGLTGGLTAGITAGIPYRHSIKQMFCLFNTGMTSEVRSIILKGFGRHSIDDIHRCVSDLVKGKRKTCKGWSMVKI